MNKLIEERNKFFRENCTLFTDEGGFKIFGKNGCLDTELMCSFNAETARLMVEEFKKIVESKKNKTSYPKGISPEYKEMSEKYDLWTETLMDDLLQSLTEL